ncbi:preprotein translocase subunit YajC [Pseudochelatococcus contaminans]|uniref:preprotein translocase subunit YajC n=1 Tax=Pseudochelatococcus contaminans TaxID=1538103 RepID=UPI0031B58C77
MISTAFAQGAAPAASGADIFIQFIPFVLIFVVMWFLILRPQQKRAKAHQEMVKSVRRGDTIVTSGGFIAKVSRVIDDNEIEAEIADGVRVRIVRSTIAEVRSRSEPVKSEASSS